MWSLKCPYCPGTQGRCATTVSSASGAGGGARWVSECCLCGRVVEECHPLAHDLFLLRAQDSPLSLVTPDLSFPNLHRPRPSPAAGENVDDDDEDPFEPTGFITAFSTWSLEPSPIYALSSVSVSGHLAELERALDSTPSSSPSVVLDNLRAYLQIIDVASILALDRDISDHAFQLFRDCSSATCLRNRSVEALATAALVQAIREAQEPRTLQEISTAANLPQKEIGKYIKILGEALKLSQPINSNSISVHMPRFCTLLQLNKTAQSLATHIGEVVINKCFCTRRNPISISAAAIYLACQLEDKRKTQAEICKVTGLTEVTLRKVYKELLENWDDLLPPNYTPAVPPEKAFPTTTIASSRPSNTKVEPAEGASSSCQPDEDRQTEVLKQGKRLEIPVVDYQSKGKEEIMKAGISGSSLVPCRVSNVDPNVLSQGSPWQPHHMFGIPTFRPEGGRIPIPDRHIDVNETLSDAPGFDHKNAVDCNITSKKVSNSMTMSASHGNSNPWPFHQHGSLVSHSHYVQFVPTQMVSNVAAGHRRIESSSKGEEADPSSRNIK